jgi:hypothetical protein
VALLLGVLLLPPGPARAEADSESGERPVSVPGGVRATHSPGFPRIDAPHIPEPMVFDLVRGLGAKRGEFEANTLVRVPFASRRRGTTVLWAPEIEYALFDGFALELELPIENFSLVALKGAAQGTFSYSGKLAHGYQVIAEYMLDHQVLESTALYLFGAKLSERWSLMTMSGVRLESELLPGRGGAFAGLGLLHNTNLFYAVTPELNLGLESNFAYAHARPYLLLMPQLHFAPSPMFNIQLGAGMQFVQGERQLVASTRMVVSI